jgi:DNA polymerase IV
MDARIEPRSSSSLDLSSVPPIFILPTHIPADDLHRYEGQVHAAQGALTYDPEEARVFVGKVEQKKRAGFELRAIGIWTEESIVRRSKMSDTKSLPRPEPSRKRRKISHEHESKTRLTSSSSEDSAQEDSTPKSAQLVWPDLTSDILVLNLEWLVLCLKHNTLLPYAPHLVYSGKLIPKPKENATDGKSSTLVTYIKATPQHPNTASSSRLPEGLAGSAASHSPRRFQSSSLSRSPRITKHSPPKLHRTTTSEHEERSRGVSPSNLPPLPEWAKGHHASYACCRSTPANPPNSHFISQLSAIKLARTLTLDEIGVRAYSTSIASISAYPHRITSEHEILRLPGCNNRIAELWREWFDSMSDDPSPAADKDRSISHMRTLASDPDMQVLRLFYDIWGVGADTARKLLFTHHFRDLDDIVEYHWHALTRVQQIGVKFYDEFKIPIPRAEVEDIATVIRQHARNLLLIPEPDFNGPNDIVCVIVGGYRRGKAESGDVDVVISHRDESKTKDLVIDLVRSLETEGWITHTLTLHTTTSDRDQNPLPFRTGHGHGFDSLDKALCVWQDPHFPSSTTQPPDLQPNQPSNLQSPSQQSAPPSGPPSSPGEEVAKTNTNIHRRVDIILSPWRTVGTAILGWSGGTTFQRDLRRFAKKEKGWKFDSSGVRDRGTGKVIDLESPKRVKRMGGRGEGPQGDGDEDWEKLDTWEERERRVMDGLGVGWRRPEERCTG